MSFRICKHSGMNEMQGEVWKSEEVRLERYQESGYGDLNAKLKFETLLRSRAGYDFKNKS